VHCTIIPDASTVKDTESDQAYGIASGRGMAALDDRGVALRGAKLPMTRRRCHFTNRRSHDLCRV